MAHGSIANSAYAMEWIRQESGNNAFGPLHRLLVLLLAEECCSGAAIARVHLLASQCGVSVEEVGEAFESLSLAGVICSKMFQLGGVAFWLPIADSGEVKNALDHLLERRQ